MVEFPDDANEKRPLPNELPLPPGVVKARSRGEFGSINVLFPLPKANPDITGLVSRGTLAWLGVLEAGGGEKRLPRNELIPSSSTADDEVFPGTRGGLLSEKGERVCTDSGR
jgi:hypothetical protein